MSEDVQKIKDLHTENQYAVSHWYSLFCFETSGNEIVGTFSKEEND